LSADETSDKPREHGTEKKDDERPENLSSHEEKSGTRKEGSDRLSLRDWLALIIAALQTVLLPLVLLLGFLFIITIIVTILF